MLALVKKPHTKKILFRIHGQIPGWLILRLKDAYGKNIDLKDESESRLVNINETEWFKNINNKMTPGDYVKIYRENMGLSQEKLGNILGNFSRQNISAIENGRRSISKNAAKKLSVTFKIPVDRFI
jgi:antitoxin component HigA of HigAB toxin-antitoxin module